MPWDRKRLLGYVETIQLILAVTDKVETRAEFNKANASERSLFWYLSLLELCKAWHQYNECLQAIASLNSPQHIDI